MGRSENWESRKEKEGEESLSWSPWVNWDNSMNTHTALGRDWTGLQKVHGEATLSWTFFLQEKGEKWAKNEKNPDIPSPLQQWTAEKKIHTQSHTDYLRTGRFWKQLLQLHLTLIDEFSWRFISNTSKELQQGYFKVKHD